MKIIVKAKPGAKMEKVERLNQPSFDFGNTAQEMDIYRVSVKEAPENGKANDAIIRALALHFDISRSSVQLVAGASSRKKIFEIKTISSSPQLSQIL